MNNPSNPGEKLRLAFGKAYAIEIMDRYVGLSQAVINHFQRPLAVMQGRIARLKSFSRWCDVRMSNIGQDGGRAIFCMFDDSSTKFIRRPFKTKGEVRAF
jgi:hypothetical protein